MIDETDNTRLIKSYLEQLSPDELYTVAADAKRARITIEKEEMEEKIRTSSSKWENFSADYIFTIHYVRDCSYTEFRGERLPCITVGVGPSQETCEEFGNMLKDLGISLTETGLGNIPREFHALAADCKGAGGLKEYHIIDGKVSGPVSTDMGHLATTIDYTTRGNETDDERNFRVGEFRDMSREVVDKVDKWLSDRSWDDTHTETAVPFPELVVPYKGFKIRGKPLVPDS